MKKSKISESDRVILEGDLKMNKYVIAWGTDGVREGHHYFSNLDDAFDFVIKDNDLNDEEAEDLRKYDIMTQGYCYEGVSENGLDRWAYIQETENNENTRTFKSIAKIAAQYDCELERITHTIGGCGDQYFYRLHNNKTNSSASCKNLKEVIECLPLARSHNEVQPCDETRPEYMALHALNVIVLDARINDFLLKNDPQALKQVREAAIALRNKIEGLS